MQLLLVYGSETTVGKPPEGSPLLGFSSVVLASNGAVRTCIQCL